MLDVETKLGDAVKYFWRVRSHQQKRQGSKTGVKDAGKRGSVTGGKHADGFIKLIGAIVRDAGLPDVSIHVSNKNGRTLPGFFRPTKEWDLVVTSNSDIFICWKKLQSRCDLSAVKNFPCSKLTKRFKNARMHRVARNSVVALSGNFYTMQLATLRPTKSLENAASSSNQAKN